jgi:uncharacterized 2Fe-2S/4Fe-4S cluster protein (DUF4445 family)
MHRVLVLPANVHMEVPAGMTLLDALRQAGFSVDAPCGGRGTCGKCRVTVDDVEQLACQTKVDRDMAVELPREAAASILTETFAISRANAEGYSLAFDIGTTTVVGFLLDGGTELACESARNPQSVYGADVISRIQYALKTDGTVLTKVIRDRLTELTEALCGNAGVAAGDIRRVSFVGNPAMQQLFLGIKPDNLARLPFSPVLTEMREVAAKECLPCLQKASLLIVPDISGFVGADTVAAVMASGMDRRAQTTLLVDIGTNGEMVLANRGRMAACSTAAGPALEGAGIRFGMPGRTGAIDHVWLEKGELKCSVIGGGAAVGICGSGIVDAVAAALELGLLNKRGKILREDGIIPLTETVYLTQADIRQVQLAKGAIAAGIEQLAEHLGIALADIDRVYLAGAFGTYMDPASACRIGLLQPALLDKITALGNAAGSGAQLLAADRAALEYAQALANTVEFVELAAMPRFSRCFAKNMEFTEG